MTFINTNNLKDTPDIQVYQAVGKRDEQQDSYIVCRMDSGVLLAVADGHGGPKTSSKVSAILPGLFHQELESAYKTDSNLRYSGITDPSMRKVVKQTIQSLIECTQEDISGSTLTVAYLEQGSCRNDQDFYPKVRVTVGQMGDSIFALSTKPGHLCGAPMHSARNNKDDVHAIKRAYLAKYDKECLCSCGYIYSHDNGVDALAVTRALGDVAYALIRKPEVKTYSFAPDQAVLLLASDGILTDLRNPRKLIEGYMDQLHQGKIATDIGKEIQIKDDNTTIIGVRF